MGRDRDFFSDDDFSFDDDPFSGDDPFADTGSDEFGDPFAGDTEEDDLFRDIPDQPAATAVPQDEFAEDFDPFAGGPDEDLPSDFTEEGGPNRSFILIGGILAVVFLIAVLIVALLIIGQEEDAESDIPATNAAIRENADETQTALAQFSFDSTATAIAAGTMIAEGTNAAATNAAGTAIAVASFTDTPTTTPSPQPTSTAAPNQGRFLGPGGQPVIGVPFSLSQNAPEDATGIDGAPGDGEDGTDVVADDGNGNLSQQATSADGRLGLLLPENWPAEDVQVGADDYLIFAENSFAQRTITAQLEDAENITALQGSAGTLLLIEGLGGLSEENLDAYLRGRIEEEEAALLEDEFITISSDYAETIQAGRIQESDAQAEGYFAVLDFGDALVEMRVLSPVTDFGEEGSLLLNIIQSVRLDPEFDVMDTGDEMDDMDEMEEDGEDTAVPAATEEAAEDVVVPPASGDVLDNTLLGIMGVTGLRFTSVMPAEDGGVQAYLEVNVAEGFNNQETAEALFDAALNYAIAEYGNENIAPFQFNAVLWDQVGPAVDWEWQEATESWLQTEQAATPAPSAPTDIEASGAYIGSSSRTDGITLMNYAPVQQSGYAQAGPTPTLGGTIDPGGNIIIPPLEPGSTYYLEIPVDNLAPGEYTIEIGGATIAFELPVDSDLVALDPVEIVQSNQTTAFLVIVLVGGAPDVTPTPTNTLAPGVTPSPSPTLDVTPSISPTPRDAGTLSPFDMTATALAGSPSPTILPEGGFFEDLGDSPSSSGLALLAFLGAGLVAVVVVARRLRSMV